MNESSAVDIEPTSPAAAIPPGVPAILLVLLTLGAYLPALVGGYIWDDDFYLTNNRNITSPQGLLHSWTQTSGSGANPQYYPMVFTTFWLEFRVWGGNAFGYHLDNVLLHAANSLLILLVLRRLRVPGAWFGAALFAVHPVNVESVAWITERKNVLSTFFYLLSLLAYFRFLPLDAIDHSNSAARPRWGWYPVALAMFALALFSKTVACSLPAAIVLLLWWKRDRLRVADIAPLIPMFVLGLCMALVTSHVEHEHVRAKDLMLNLTPPHRILLAGRAVWFYLSKLLLPVKLTFIYPKWVLDPRSIGQYAYPLALAALLLVLWLQRRRIGKAPLMVALLYVGTLVPALGFVDVYPMRYSWVADHFQYLACIAPLAALAAVLCDCLDARVFAVICTAAIGVLGPLTYVQAGIYRDPFTLWRDTLDKNDGAWMAHNNLAALLSTGNDPKQLAEARQHLERAISINPEHTQSYNNLAYLALAEGHPQEAIEYCERAMRVPNAELLEVFNNYGLALYTLGRDDEAIPQFEKSIRIKNVYIPARVNLSRALLRIGRNDDAQKQLEIVFKLAPNLTEPHFLLAESLLKRNRIDEGLAQLQAATNCNPRDPGPRYKFAMALASAHRTPEAISEARQIVMLAPPVADGHNLLGTLLLEARQFDEAVRELTEAVRLAPNMVEARFNLGDALLKAGRAPEAAKELREVLRLSPGDTEAQRLLDNADRRAGGPSGAPGKPH